MDFLHAREFSPLNLRFKPAQFPRYPDLLTYIVAVRVVRTEIRRTRINDSRYYHSKLNSGRKTHRYLIRERRGSSWIIGSS